MENELRELSKERKSQERWDRLWKESTGENIYIEFKAWCNAYKKGEGKNNPYIFAEFLKENNINLGFWQKKCIAKKYFGYDFEYNYDKKVWEITKK